MEDRYGYPKVIKSIGDEFKAHRMDRGLSQKEVATMLNVSPGFIFLLESGKVSTIKGIHAVYTFLGRLPLRLNVDETTPQGKLFVYRIRTGDTLRMIAKELGIDINALIRFTKQKGVSNRTLERIERYLKY